MARIVIQHNCAPHRPASPRRGQITATLSTHDAATLVTLTGEHAYTITLASDPATAEDLNTIDGKTSETVTATAVTSISGAASAFDVLLAAQVDGTIDLSSTFDATIDIGTLVVPILSEEEARTESFVKAVCAFDGDAKVAKKLLGI